MRPTTEYGNWLATI